LRLLKSQEISIDAQTLHLIILINILIWGGVETEPALLHARLPVCCSLGIAKRIFTKCGTGELETVDRFQFPVQPDTARDDYAYCCARNSSVTRRMFVGAENVPDRSCRELRNTRFVFSAPLRKSRGFPDNPQHPEHPEHVTNALQCSCTPAL
jgi:hypothetical protein